MDLYIGKKLYYMNKLYQVVFCEIIQIIDNDAIIIENEHGKKLQIKSKWINSETNKIVKPCEKERGTCIQCICGSIRFNYNSIDKKIICKDCGSEWESKEIDTLDTTKYKSECKEKIILN